MMRASLTLAAGVVCALATAAPAQDNSATINRYLSLVEDLGFSGSVVVTRGEAAILERHLGLADRDAGVPIDGRTLFDCGSIAKSFTAAAILRLVDQGKLRLTDRLSTHLEEVPLHARSITVEQLLRHTSGIQSRADFQGVEMESPGEVARLILANTPITPPGRHYRYDNMGYTLAAMIAEKASGKEFPQLLADEVFGPAGLASACTPGSENVPDEAAAHGYMRGADTGSCSQYPYHYGYRGSTAVLTTALDLAKWSRATWSGPLLSEKSRAVMFTRGLGGYGLGWNIDDVAEPRRAALGDARIRHGGSTMGFDASLTFWPRASGGHLASVVLANDRFWLPTVAEDVDAMATGDSPAAGAMPEVGVLAAADLGAFAGEYASESGERLLVEVDARKRPGVGAAIRIRPLSQVTFDRLFLGGAYNTSRTNDALRIWPRAEALVKEYLFSGKSEGVMGAFRDPESEEAIAFYSRWSSLVRELGEPTRVDPLYTGLRALVDRTLVTRVAIVFPKGTRMLTIYWTGKVEKAAGMEIGAMTIGAAITFEPAADAAAGAARTAFSSYRPQGITAPRVMFVRSAVDAEVSAIELLGDDGKIAMTLTKQPSTPIAP